MQTNDYGTISLYNADSLIAVSQSFYSSSATGSVLVDTTTFDATSSFSSVPITTSINYWNNVEVNVSSSLGIQSYRYEVSDETHREKVRFAFINKLGAWDYFNNYNPVQQTTAVNREQYTANRVDYSSLTSTYDITRRGLSDFHTSVDDSFTVQTDYLDKTNANWLEELIESPSVYIQRNGEFIPIVILNSSYTANTNQARQKLFQYTLEFIPSNQPFGTWIPEYVECPNVSSTPPVVETYAATNVNSSSVTLNGEVTNDGGLPIVQQGFIYSISSSTIPLIVGGASTTNITSSNLGEGTYSENADIRSSTYYQYRAYASNSLGVNYGDTFYFDTILNGFDPTFQNTLQPELWYDFTDASSVDFTSSADYGIETIYNKGRWYNYSISGSLSVDQNPLVAFNGNWSPPIMTPGQYTQFSADLVDDSLPGAQGSTTALPHWIKNNNVYSTVWDGSACTFIYFVRPEYKEYVTASQAQQGDIIGFASTNPFPGTNPRFSNLHLLYMSTGSIPTEPDEPPYLASVDPITYVTGSTLASSSMLLFTQQGTGCGISPSTPTKGTALVVSDAMGEPTWHSYYLRYESGSGGAPYGDFGLTTAVNTDINQAIKVNPSLCGGGSHEAYGLVIGSNAASRATVAGGRNFKISHFLAYTSSLSDAEIDQVMTQFSQSVDFGNEINVYN